MGILDKLNTIRSDVFWQVDLGDEIGLLMGRWSQHVMKAKLWELFVLENNFLMDSHQFTVVDILQ